jgi:hypothetical protein
MKILGWMLVAGVFLLLMADPSELAGAPKVHTVALGGVRKVPYSKAGDPAGAAAEEVSLKIRPLLVDAILKEWVTGEAHDVTDRSFVMRRAIRLNDALPGEAQARAAKTNSWVWQRGPWLLVDRVSGHIAALKLPDYDPGVSQVSWFRDYGAYCGLTASGKSLYAVVASWPCAKQCWRGSCNRLTRPIIRRLSASRPRGSAIPCGLPSTLRNTFP